MLTHIRMWIYGAVILAFTAGAALLYRKGRKDEQDKHTRRRLDTMKEKQDVDRDMETMDDKRLSDLISRDD